MGYVPHACIRQGGIQRHDGSQIRSAPVEDAHFSHASDSLGFAKHKEFAFLLINREVPDDAAGMGIAFEEKLLEFQFDLSRGAGMCGTRPKLDGLAGEKQECENGCCNNLE